MDVPCRDLEPIKKDHLSFIEDYQTGLAPPDKSARYANKRQAFAGNIQRKFFNKVRKGEKENLEGREKRKLQKKALFQNFLG